MMSLLKNLFVIAGLIALAGLGYYLFVLERGADLSSTSSQSRQSEAEVQEFLRLLADVEDIRLSTNIFGDERFQSFVNFATPVEQVSAGRDNPFSTN